MPLVRGSSARRGSQQRTGCAGIARRREDLSASLAEQLVSLREQVGSLSVELDRVSQRLTALEGADEALGGSQQVTPATPSAPPEHQAGVPDATVQAQPVQAQSRRFFVRSTRYEGGSRGGPTGSNTIPPRASSGRCLGKRGGWSQTGSISDASNNELAGPRRPV